MGWVTMMNSGEEERGSCLKVKRVGGVKDELRDGIAG